MKKFFILAICLITVTSLSLSAQNSLEDIKKEIELEINKKVSEKFSQSLYDEVKKKAEKYYRPTQVGDRIKFSYTYAKGSTEEREGTFSGYQGDCILFDNKLYLKSKVTALIIPEAECKKKQDSYVKDEFEYPKAAYALEIRKDIALAIYKKNGYALDRFTNEWTLEKNIEKQNKDSRPGEITIKGVRYENAKISFSESRNDSKVLLVHSKGKTAVPFGDLLPVLVANDYFMSKELREYTSLKIHQFSNDGIEISYYPAGGTFIKFDDCGTYVQDLFDWQNIKKQIEIRQQALAEAERKRNAEAERKKQEEEKPHTDAMAVAIEKAKKKENYEDAIKLLEDAIRSYPNATNSEDANNYIKKLNKDAMAVAIEKAKNEETYEDAISILEDAIRSYPNAKNIEDANNYMKKLKGNLAKAIKTKPSPSPKNQNEIWELGGSEDMSDDQRRAWAIEQGQYVVPDDLFFAVLERDMSSDVVVSYSEKEARKTGPDGLTGWYIFKVPVKYITGGGFERWDEWNYKIKNRGNILRVRIGGKVFNTYEFIAGPRSQTSGFFPELDNADKVMINGVIRNLR